MRSRQVNFPTPESLQSIFFTQVVSAPSRVGSVYAPCSHEVHIIILLEGSCLLHPEYLLLDRVLQWVKCSVYLQQTLAGLLQSKEVLRGTLSLLSEASWYTIQQTCAVQHSTLFPQVDFEKLFVSKYSRSFIGSPLYSAFFCWNVAISLSQE